ncbi:GNAT family N-acetyltransferase [Aeromonas salmonicida]|nr:GNAT family N-acetyltransferase [Aeromonas salmonicida]
MFPPGYVLGTSHWEHLLRSAHCETWLLLDRKGELVAYLCILLHQHWNCLIVLTLAVHPRARRSGWGRWLLERLIDRGRAEGGRAIRLEVSELNKEGLILYERLGFRVLSQLTDYYGPDHHGQRRERAL